MPKKMEQTASEWMKANGYSWNLNKTLPKREMAKTSSSKQARVHKGQSISRNDLDYGQARKAARASIREFVDGHRDSKSRDCIFVPLATINRPAKVVYCGKSMSAARYMCLLTHGTPKHEGMEARHLCGNGHLSCINPSHVVWGTRGDNQSDANHHRHAGDNVQDRINSVTR